MTGWGMAAEGRPGHRRDGDERLPKFPRRLGELRPRNALNWLVVVGSIDALLVVADVTIGQLASVFVITPLLLAVVAGPAVTGAAAVTSVALASASAAWSTHVDATAHVARIAIVAAGGAFAYYAAVRRRHSELTAGRLEAAAAVSEMVQASPVAVIGIDLAGTITLFSPAAEEMFGYRVEQAVGQELARLIVPPALREQHRAGLARFRATGESQVLGRRLDFDAMRSNGELFPVALTIARLPGGGPAAFAGFVRDVTEEKRAERANVLRGRTAELIASASAYEQTLQEAARLPIPELADRCWIEMPRPDGRVVVLADDSGLHTDAAAQTLEPFDVTMLDDAAGSACVIATGRPVLAPDVTDEWLAAYTRDAAELGRLRAARIGSMMVVPLKAGRRTIGAMSFAGVEPGRRFSEDDLELAEELAERAGTAIDNARLYRERARTISTLMAGLRPPEIPDLPGWRTAALYRPAGRIDEAGGDFYDLFRAGPGWMLVIGDVLGHGPPAAALTSLARYSIRTAATLTGSPKAALDHLNDELRRDERLTLLTAACVLLWESPDGPAARIAIAGHPRPVLVRDGRPRLVGEASVVLGAADDAEYRESVLSLRPDDCLVLYTDGVLDTAASTDRFGEERLIRALAGSIESPQTAIDRLDTALARFQTRTQRDDIAVVAIQRAGLVWPERLPEDPGDPTVAPPERATTRAPKRADTAMRRRLGARAG